MRKTTQRWWQQAGEHCEEFLEATAQLNTYTPPERIRDLIDMMRAEMTIIESLSYHPDCAEARQHLLDAMRGMLMGFDKALSGNFSEAEAYIQNAHTALCSFDHLLGERVA
ncbi:MAG: hypothetical protein OHK0046_16620 [Anaerolineae bacterium]